MASVVGAVGMVIIVVVVVVVAVYWHWGMLYSGICYVAMLLC